MATYSAWQVYDALKRKGYSNEQASAMAMAIGDGRVDEAGLKRGLQSIGITRAVIPTADDGKMGGNLIPNLGEGLGAAAGYAWAGRKPSATKWGGGAKRLALTGLGAILGGSAGQAATGTNYYERASDPQLLADIGGSIAGGAVAERALTSAAGKLAASKLAGTTLGRVLGMAGGPAGSLIGGALGGALGGWAASNLIPGGSKSVEEEDKHLSPSDKAGYATLGGLTAAAATAPWAYKKLRGAKAFGNPFAKLSPSEAQKELRDLMNVQAANDPGMKRYKTYLDPLKYVSPYGEFEAASFSNPNRYNWYRQRKIGSLPETTLEDSVY